MNEKRNVRSDFGAIPRVLGEPADPNLDHKGRRLNLFFSDNIVEINQAREICSSCPLKASCLEYATFAEEFGVWGGTTAGERKKLRQGKPLFTLEERRYAVDFRNDLKRLTAEAFAMKYKMTVRNCFRWKQKLGVEDLAS